LTFGRAKRSRTSPRSFPRKKRTKPKTERAERR
jgi:hypothetical protein